MSEIPFVLLVFFVLGSYVQTVTGFAFGLVVMSAAALFSVVSLEVAAFSVSVLSLLNSITGLAGGLWRQANFKAMSVFLLGSIPATVLGVYLLGSLGGEALHWLQLLLGLTIIFACGMSLMKPKKSRIHSRPWVFFLFGGFAGVLGGLFATAGPPISYLMYRQPVSLNVIRASLLSVFVISCISRIGIVTVAGQVTMEMVWLSIIGVPCVFITTILAKRYPPNIPPETIKRVAMFLLLLSGVSLSLKALI
ncbi:sulfite exporter TauE/SafE family protein [Marinomonas transparens]|uniref:Probable membrane transporter protein n=1 Tax=Marinomonas transparens TaxID=2795388 RepID=A0A934N7U7_9GAMM|nr:sulfite exporter TauE/SafE family protein [Marinomonas transparens]MBJ7539426.1 sulfite exporter TauE/SafE family protein [Marinomonas transparens]